MQRPLDASAYYYMRLIIDEGTVGGKFAWIDVVGNGPEFYFTASLPHK